MGGPQHLESQAECCLQKGFEPQIPNEVWPDTPHLGGPGRPSLRGFSYLYHGHDDHACVAGLLVRIKWVSLREAPGSHFSDLRWFKASLWMASGGGGWGGLPTSLKYSLVPVIPLAHALYTLPGGSSTSALLRKLELPLPWNLRNKASALCFQTGDPEAPGAGWHEASGVRLRLRPNHPPGMSLAPVTSPGCRALSCADWRREGL